MKRIWIVVGIFAAILGVSLFGTFYAKATYEEILRLTEADKPAALRSYWEERADVLCVFTRNAPIDEISRLCAKLPEAKKAEDTADYKTVLEEIKVSVLHVYQSEIPRLHNIF